MTLAMQINHLNNYTRFDFALVEQISKYMNWAKSLLKLFISVYESVRFVTYNKYLETLSKS